MKVIEAILDWCVMEPQLQRSKQEGKGEGEGSQCATLLLLRRPTLTSGVRPCHPACPAVPSEASLTLRCTHSPFYCCLLLLLLLQHRRSHFLRTCGLAPLHTQVCLTLHCPLLLLHRPCTHFSHVPVQPCPSTSSNKGLLYPS